MDKDYDVVVIGGGGAGMCAAIEASNAGASVALLEADTKLGGSTALSGGVFYAAGTSVQASAGVKNDSSDAMFEYYMLLNQHKVEASCARAICDHAGDGVEWLIDLGVNFPPEALYCSGSESVPRGHSPEGNGAAIAAALEAEISKRAVDVALNTRVQELTFDQSSGSVTGVNLDGEQVHCSAVVIATGGFGADPHLIHKYYPEAAKQGDWLWYIGNSNCRGDGLLLGESAGADIVGFNRGLLLTTPNFQKVIEPYSPGWLVFVNREGRRFVNEMDAYAVMSGVINEQTGSSCFVIFDDAAKSEAHPSPEMADAFAAGIVALNWVSEEVDRQVEKGKILRTDSFDEIEYRCGITPGSLKVTIATYNADVEAGVDSQYFKDPAQMKPIRTPPYYVAELKPATLCLTSTGLKVNAQAQVINCRNQVVDGLFAAGETTGNVLGERYIGGGNSIANAVVFGRIAGNEAARQSLSNR